LEKTLAAWLEQQDRVNEVAPPSKNSLLSALEKMKNKNTERLHDLLNNEIKSSQSDYTIVQCDNQNINGNSIVIIYMGLLL
jgi:hypothetical protein